MNLVRPRRPRASAGRSRAVLVLLAAVLALTGCSSGGDVGDPTRPSAAAGASPSRSDPAQDPALARFYGQRPNWERCGELECARLTVPMDWSQPAGATIELAVARSRAGGERLGSLLLNPGGPGASGVDYLRSSGDQFADAVTDAYDRVSWDPRGVGASNAIRCLPNEDLDRFYSVEATPDDAQELQQVLQDVKVYAEACRRNTGELLEHVDTLSTVRDMDVLRAVLGDEVLTYYGASYGTFLGAWYAETFPWRVGRLVLDGAVDPSLDATGYIEGQALGFSRAVRAYVTDCLDGRDCPLRGSVDEAYAQIEALVERSDSAPLRTASGRDLTQALLTTGLAQGMYDRRLWPTVSKALGEALQGNGTTMLALADAYLQRDQEGRYAGTIQATGPMFCLDHPEERTAEQVAELARTIADKYPPLGESSGWGSLLCSQWPIEPVVPARKLTAQGAAPIVVVGSTGDPATPYEWAQALASQLSSGVLVTRRGEGHTGYRQGNRCVDTAVDAYLVSGKAPEEDLTCS